MNPTPFKWMTIDLETIAGSPDDADHFIRDCYRPESFASWAEHTIGKRVKEAHAKKRERLALLTAAPIICASIRSDQCLACIHCMKNGTAIDTNGTIIWYHDGAKEMLIGLRDFLDYNVSPDTVIVGHNIAAFDLPKLRWAYTHHGVRMPQVLACPKPNVYDTMREYTRSYAVGASSMIALDALLEEFQINSHKGLISGADVQELYDTGKHDTIIQYAILDVIAESELYLRMTGQAEALK